MKAVINTVATSIQTEVVASIGSPTIKKYDRIWRNPTDGKVLSIYGGREFPGEFRTTGNREDIFEVILEYCEPSDAQVLDKVEASELALYDVASALKEWADNHQTLTGIHRFDWVGTDHSPIMRGQELLTRFFQMRFQARGVEAYGS